MTEESFEVLDMLEEVGAIQGVRGALVATSEGAYAEGRHSGLEMMVAHDIAKTVRRMVVASSTVGAPLEELLINFGAARMMILPVQEDATLVVMLERDTATGPVRRLLEVEMVRFRRLFDGPVSELPDGSGVAVQDEEDDEVAELVGGELGPVLREIETCYSGYVQKTGATEAHAHALMREQMKEWLLCCNPSPYTFPLLLDGLSQTLNGAPAERSGFMNDMQEILRRSGMWQGTNG